MTETTPKTSPLLSNKTFDFLKFLAQILLPGAGTLYFALAGIWSLPNADQVVGTVVAVDTFLGLLLGLSTKAYNSSDNRYDGVLSIENTDEGSNLRLKSVDAAALATKNEILFKLQNK